MGCLENRVGIVTGASKGIGAAVAYALAREGADVVINYNESENEARRLRKEIARFGNRVVSIKADVSSFNGARDLIDECINYWERIDILVNNAGIFPRSDFFEVSEEEWDKTMDTNLKGTFFCSQKAGGYMARAGRGSIVNIASNCVLRAKNGVGIPYSASKAGVINLTRDLARSLGKDGIKVNCVAPGFTSTDMANYDKGDEVYSRIEGELPFGSVNDPEDIAQSVLFFASDASKNVTGQVLYVDGGYNL